MKLVPWMLIGGFGSLVLVVTVALMMSQAVDGALTFGAMTIGGFLSVVLWGTWAFGATNLRQVTACCEVVIADGFNPLALIGILFAALSLLMGVTGTGSLLDVRGERTR